MAPLHQVFTKCVGIVVLLWLCTAVPRTTPLETGAGGSSDLDVVNADVSMTTVGMYTTVIVRSHGELAAAFRLQYRDPPLIAFNVSTLASLSYRSGVLTVSPTQASAPPFVFALEGEDTDRMVRRGSTLTAAVIGIARFDDPSQAIPLAGPSDPSCPTECDDGGPSKSTCSVSSAGGSCSTTCATGYYACCTKVPLSCPCCAR